MASAASGSSTITAWKRRSKALSFSMYFWYSFSVVAPMACSSPRASAGLSKLAASIAPSPPPPAPINVWISSMNRIISPSASVTSLITDLSRSSNSPLYLAPATSRPMSREIKVLDFKFSGTSPDTIRWAKPSTMAVFPTPGSPSRMGLFLVRRARICKTRLISSSRPITGSIFPFLANSFRFLEYFSKALYVLSAFGSVTLFPFLSSFMASISAFSPTPWFFSSWAMGSIPANMPKNKCSRAT